MALTPKQKKQLVMVSHWGHLFVVFWDLGFLVEKGLVCKPTAGEIDAHYAAIGLKLQDTKRELTEAVAANDFQTVKKLAGVWEELATDLQDRSEQQERLAVLSPAGIAALEKLQAGKVA
jgi:hypothetical protein